MRHQFGRTLDVDIFNVYPHMAQAFSYISSDEDIFNRPLNPALLYWLCPFFEMFGAMVQRVCAAGIEAIVIAPMWDEQILWWPIMAIT